VLDRNSVSSKLYRLQPLINYLEFLKFCKSNFCASVRTGESEEIKFNHHQTEVVNACRNCTSKGFLFYWAIQPRLGPLQWCSNRLRFFHEPNTLIKSFSSEPSECVFLYNQSLKRPFLSSLFGQNLTLFSLLEDPDFVKTIIDRPSDFMLIVYNHLGKELLLEFLFLSHFLPISIFSCRNYNWIRFRNCGGSSLFNLS